jgi:LysM repeat protein
MAAIAYPQRSTHPIPTLELVSDRAASDWAASSSRASGAAVYARRRLVAALLAVVALVLVAQLALAVLHQAGPSTVRVGPHTGSGTVLVKEPSVFGASGADLPVGAVYVVRPGDTLWSIADAMAPGADVTATVERLTALNGSSAIQVGQRLHLD